MSPGTNDAGMVLHLEVEADTWLIQGPESHQSAQVPSLLRDVGFVARVSVFLRCASESLRRGTPETEAYKAGLDQLARELGERLTTALLSPETRKTVARRLVGSPSGRARLTLRVEGGQEAERVLALPWELLMPEPGRFAVYEAQLDLVREAFVEGAPDLPEPTEPLALAVVVAAPEGQSPLNHEEEEFRLHSALAPQGHSLAFAGLGELEDFLEKAKEVGATALHFSGHGEPRSLIFEDAYGGSDPVEVDRLVRELRRHLGTSGGAPAWPRLFFLASCYGAADGVPALPLSPAGTAPGPGAPLLDRGPSTAAALHRAGITQVVGFLTKVYDNHSTQVAEAFYRAVAKGQTTLQAVAEARAHLNQPIIHLGVAFELPYAWSLLVLYHRGPDRPLALPQVKARHSRPRSFVRQEEELRVSGLPALKFGFIGRRVLQHEVRRKLQKEARKLLVIHGEGGMGKTALALWIVRRVLTTDENDVLVLPCAQVRDPEKVDAAYALWQYVDGYAQQAGIAGWEEHKQTLGNRVAQEQLPESWRFEQALRFLQSERPNLVVYADNLETLQEGPLGEGVEQVGRWLPGAETWWAAMERYAGQGVVLGTVRYVWKQLPVEARVAITELSRAEALRMISCCPRLGELSGQVQNRLADATDRHPYTIKILDDIIRYDLQNRGMAYQVQDEWEELVAPHLPYGQLKVEKHLLLDGLWKLLSQEEQQHMKRLTFLQAPAPPAVLDALGGSTNKLIELGLLMRVPERVRVQIGWAWEDRWSLHGVVARFAQKKLEGGEESEAHALAGEEYAKLLESNRARSTDVLQAIHHLHRAGKGDRAWTWVAGVAIGLRDMAQYTQAQKLLEESMAAGVGADNRALALTLMAQIQVRTGTYDDMVVSILDQALAVSEKDTTQSFILHDKGVLKERQGKYEEAEMLLLQSLAIKEKVLGSAHPSYGASLHALAGVLEKQGKYEEAEKLLRQSLAIQENALRSTHPSYGASLHELAGVLERQGKYEETEELLWKSLAIKEKVLGSTHPSYGASLHALAVLLASQGKYEEAEKLLWKSLAIREKALGSTHPEYGASLHALAVVLSRQGKYEEAEKLLRQSLAIREKALGSTHPEYGVSLHALAGVLSRQGKYEEAERLLRQSLVLVERALGSTHPSLCPTLVNLGAVLAEQTRLQEGEVFAQRAADIAIIKLGLNHPETAQILNVLAQLQAGLRKPEAAATARRALEALIGSLGPTHPITQDAGPVLLAIAGSGTQQPAKPPAGGGRSGGLWGMLKKRLPFLR